MRENLKQFFRDHVSFSFKTPSEKITLIAAIVGEVVIGILIVYAVLFGPL